MRPCSISINKSVDIKVSASSQPSTQIPNSTALVLAFFAAAWTMARSRSGSAFAGGYGAGRAVAVCSPTQEREAEEEQELRPHWSRMRLMRRQF